MTAKSMPLGVNGLKLGETVRNLYRITANPGSAPDDVLRPEFWVHVASKLRVGDKIEIMAADTSWYGELCVMEVGRTASAGVRVAFTLPAVSLTNEQTLPDQKDYIAQPVGSSWSVFKVGADAPVKADLPDRAAADKWITSQRRALAA